MVPGLYLLLEVVLHAHGELVELVPLLRQTHRAVLRVAVVQDQVFLQSGAYTLQIYYANVLETPISVVLLYSMYVSSFMSQQINSCHITFKVIIFEFSLI